VKIKTSQKVDVTAAVKQALLVGKATDARKGRIFYLLATHPLNDEEQKSLQQLVKDNGDAKQSRIMPVLFARRPRTSSSTRISRMQPVVES